MNTLKVGMHLYGWGRGGAHYSVLPLAWPKIGGACTANILTVLSTAFGSVTFLTVIWLCILPPKIAIDLKLYSSMSLIVMGTAVGCDIHC